jgi:hypothetical protein
VLVTGLGRKRRFAVVVRWVLVAAVLRPLS